jgi:hypothetical protein
VITVDINTQYLTVLQGQTITDSTAGWKVLYLPASISGYVAVVELPSMSGVTQFTTYARGSANANNVLRYELYEDGKLIYTGYRGVSTSYTWAEFGAWIFHPERKYVIKIWFAGGVDVYLRIIVTPMHRKGSTCFVGVHYIVLDATAIGQFLWDATGNFYYSYIYQWFPSSLSTVTSTVNNTLRALYVNTTLKYSEAYNYGLQQATSYFTVGTMWWYFYGLTTRVLAYNRSLTTSEVSAVNAGTVPSNGLMFYFVADPRYLYDINWDGYVDWLDLSGSNNHATLYNYHSRGSFSNAPQRQQFNMLIITQTCNAQLCSYTVYGEDPYFTVIVSDASGKYSQASTGLSVPLWQSPLGSIISTIGRITNLDAFGVNVNDFIIVLLGLGVIYAAFTFLTWEYAVIFLGIWLSVGTLLLGGSGKLVPPGLGLVVFGAILSLLLRKEREV